MKAGSRIAVVAAGLLAAACQSGPPGPPGGGPPGGPGGPGRGGNFQDGKIARPISLLFVSLDTNHDLVLTADELAAGTKAEFARADTDRNGLISGFEMMDWDKTVLGDAGVLPDLQSMDPDFSSTLTPTEFENGLRHEFDRMDENHDGVLTRAEMLVDSPRMGGMAPPGGQSAPRPSGGGGGGRGGRGGRGGGPGGGGGPF